MLEQFAVQQKQKKGKIMHIFVIFGNNFSTQDKCNIFIQFNMYRDEIQFIFVIQV